MFGNRVWYNSLMPTIGDLLERENKKKIISIRIFGKVSFNNILLKKSKLKEHVRNSMDVISNIITQV